MGFVFRFFLAVLAVTTSEFYLLVAVAQRISVGLTILLCVFTGVVSGALVKAQGLRTLRAIQSQMGSGRLPSREIVGGLVLLVMGTLLFTPGFITDTLAFIMLVPKIRYWTVSVLLNYFKRRIHIRTHPRTGSPFGGTRQQQARPQDVVIEVDGEVVEEQEPERQVIQP